MSTSPPCAMTSKRHAVQRLLTTRGIPLDMEWIWAMADSLNSGLDAPACLSVCSMEPVRQRISARYHLGGLEEQYTC